MNRSFFLIPAMTVPFSAVTAQESRPNILFCIADDASFAHFGAAGCPWVHTPNFDRVARNGLFFSNCYTPNAKSGPSRSIILTGLYSWQLKNAGNHLAYFPAEIKVFTEELSANGYNVAFTGKGWEPGDPGMTQGGEPRLLTGKAYNSVKTEQLTAGISDIDYAANFSRFLDDQTDGKPWLFWFGSREPHRIYEYGTGVSLGGKSPEDIDRVPAYYPDCDSVRIDLLDYAFEIEYFDKQLGKIIDEVAKRGQLNNTLIIVTSDNGMPFPRAKANNYEIAHHMPMVMMWTNGIRHPGRRVDDYVSFVDIAPTVLDVAGVVLDGHSMQQPEGTSLRDIFESSKSGKINPKRTFLLFGRERDDPGRPLNQGYPIRGIMCDGLLYIWNLKPELLPAGNPETGYLDIDGSPTKSVILDLHRKGLGGIFYELSMGTRPAEELYDITKDKDCMHNLALQEAYRAVKNAMKRKLVAILKQHKDPRMVGDKDIFDSYPFISPWQNGLYEKVVDGRLIEPWSVLDWVNPSDFESYHRLGN